jgi:hypothetical protein
MLCSFDQKMRAIILYLILFLPAFSLNAQSTTHPSFRAAIVLGHTFISEEHTGETTIVPSWGLDLEYWLDHHWGIGMHNDLELETFIIRVQDEEELERIFPVVITIEGFYKWKNKLVLQMGPGIELEKTQNYYLFRLGIEYEFTFGEHWDLSPTIFYDSRFDSYDTWTLGLCVGRHF